MLHLVGNTLEYMYDARNPERSTVTYLGFKDWCGSLVISVNHQGMKEWVNIICIWMCKLLVVQNEVQCIRLCMIIYKLLS